MSGGARLLLLALAALAAGNSPASAYGRKERGTSAAAFLTIPVGARAPAMGGAYSAAADDVYALYYNPAGLARIRGIQAAGMRSTHFQDVSHNFGALAVPLLSLADTRRAANEWGVLAVSLTSLSVDGIERRGTVETDAAQGVFEARDFAYVLGYGLDVASRFSAGAAVKFITQTIDSTGASAYALDAGMQYRAEKLRAGAGARNLGANLKFRERSNPLPISFYSGLGYEWREGWLGTLEISAPRDEAVVFAFGGERRRRLLGGVSGALRAGVNTADAQGEGLAGLSLGGGLTYGKSTFDLAWMPYGELGSALRFSILLRF